MNFSVYIILALYVILMVAVAMLTRHKSKTVNDFLLAGKGLNGWMTAFAYGTTYFSTVLFVGYAGSLGWKFGLSAVWIGIGNAVIGSFLAWLVMAKKTRNMTRRLQAKTMPDFFEKRFNSKNLKLVSSIIIFVFLIPYSASVYQGLGYMFKVVFKIDVVACIIILAALTALYLSFGGYFATALSDFMQGIIMIVGVFAMLFSVLNYPTIDWNFASLTQNNLGFIASKDNFFALISLLLLTSVGVWALPQTVHKFYAVRDKKAIKQATIVSSLFALIIGGGAYLTGAFGSVFFGGQMPEGGTDTIMPIMLSTILRPGFLGLIAVLLLSASMSTLSSVSLSSSSVISVDLYKGFIKKDATDKQVNFLMRILCVVFIAISVLLAIFPIGAIVSMMGISWGTLAGCFIGPFVLGVLWKRTTKLAAWVSIIGALILTFVQLIIFGYAYGAHNFFKAIKGGFAYSPQIGVITMVFSLIITVVVSLLSSPPSKTEIENSFEKEIEDLIV